MIPKLVGDWVTFGAYWVGTLLLPGWLLALLWAEMDWSGGEPS